MSDLGVKQYILRLQIPVDNVQGMHVADSTCYFCSIKLRSRF